MRKRSLVANARWWLLCVVHNMLAHPLLPLAELALVLGYKRAAGLVFWLHDHTVPEGGG